MDLGFMQSWRRGAAARFRAAGQAEAAALLLDCLRADDPIVVMTGAAGLGKTAMLDAALSPLGPSDPHVLRLAAPLPTPLGLQRQLSEMLGLAEPDAVTPAELASAIVALPEPAPGVASLAVVMDDAHAAPVALLHYLWLMHSLAARRRPVLQLILVGRDALWRRLGDQRLNGLRRGVSARLTMQPFSSGEAEAFLRQLLRNSGHRADAEALIELQRLGDGVPGRMVTLLDAACAGLPSGRDVTLDRVRRALGKPPLPAGNGRTWRLGTSGVSARWPVRRPVLVGVATGMALLAVFSWHMLTGAESPKRLPARAAAVAQPAASRPAAPSFAGGSGPLPAAVQQTPAVRDRVTLEHDLDHVGSLSRAIGSWFGEAALLADRSLAGFARRSVQVGADAASQPARVDAGVATAAPAQPPARGPAPVALAKPAAAAPLLVLSGATAVHVAVQYRRGNARAEAQAAKAVALLRASGMDAADPQPVPRPAMRAGVGYYFREDRDGAEAVARVLSDLGGESPVRELPLHAALPAPGSLDVVVDGRTR